MIDCLFQTQCCGKVILDAGSYNIYKTENINKWHDVFTSVSMKVKVTEIKMS